MICDACIVRKPWEHRCTVSAAAHHHFDWHIGELDDAGVAAVLCPVCVADPGLTSSCGCPPDLHAVIAARAAEQGVSMNALIVALLAGGVGFKLLPETRNE